ncbi:family 16 glycosylhydrolase [Streptomyces sp. NPDC001544]|uniref:family 16 glycosylhydrolase n=1 Tax=Streptomyces sp. NPDC001544 TaxID=3364584 RepID=UPI00367D47F7
MGGSTALPGDASQDFHAYAVDKQPHRVTWPVDGRPYFTLTPSKLPGRRTGSSNRICTTAPSPPAGRAVSAGC